VEDPVLDSVTVIADPRFVGLRISSMSVPVIGPPPSQNPNWALPLNWITGLLFTFVAAQSDAVEQNPWRASAWTGALVNARAIAMAATRAKVIVFRILVLRHLRVARILNSYSVAANKALDLAGG
jgi:hypothetical protein